MNKTAIKNFAVWARRKLISEITYKAGLIGITEKGISKPLSMSTDNIQFFDIGTGKPTEISDYEIKQREALVNRIKDKESTSDYKTAFQFVLEEVAYTWFNRLIAIRFMEVNDYLPSRIRVLSSETSGKSEPDMVTNPFDTDMVFSAYEKDRVMQLKHENELDELFRMLFIKQCNALNAILPMLFEKTKDYSELLLNVSFTDEDGLVYHLVNDIYEADFDVAKEGQVEILGWLYQYYNTEPKEEVFALLKKNVKISKERVPAATQLFTPDWIVRYMVENSLGRLWVEGHTNDTLKAKWKYYLDESQKEADALHKLEAIRDEYKTIKPEDIKIIDPCMGSGHILVYAFDVLMQIYESAGYTQRDAAKSILENNIFGIDIDVRAFQLAYFAVMMKARQYNRRLLTNGVSCNILSIEESNTINRDHLIYFGAGMSDIHKKSAHLQIKELMDIFIDAKEYGSLLKIRNFDWELLKQYIENIDIEGQITLDVIGIEKTKEQILVLINTGEILSQKYDITVTNPPYMGNNGMGNKLSNYVKTNYFNTKSDLFACFIERNMELTKNSGFISMITMESWMFLSSFEVLRKQILTQTSIVNMTHMPYLGKGGTSLGINFGTAAYVIRNCFLKSAHSKYTCVTYLDTDDEGTPFEFPIVNEKNKSQKQEDFLLIPGAPIGYWLTKQSFFNFSNMETIGEHIEPRIGLITGDNNRFLRYWHEVSIDRIGFNMNSIIESVESGKKWFPYQKGGEYRKWYGNLEYVVDWENDGYMMKNDNSDNGRVRSHNYNGDYSFISCITWTSVTTGNFACRFSPKGFLFDAAGPICKAKCNEDIYLILGLLTSCVAKYYLKVINPTINFHPGYIMAIPFSKEQVLKYREKIDGIVKQNISISLDDWNTSELSWDFMKHSLVQKVGALKQAHDNWTSIRKERFEQLKSNEEQLNKIFIEIYGLTEELNPEIENSEVAVNLPDLKNDIRGFISYAVGCMFGRYSLDVEGIAYAGNEWDSGKYKTFVPDKDNCIPITDEEYFGDDIVARFVEFVKNIYGIDTLEENLDFTAKALGNKGNTSKEILRNYFVKDFYKDHIKTYKKCPIYWLYDSGKQDGFKALVYIHRYTADTTGIVRVDYLHKMQKIYMSEIDRMKEMAENSRNTRDVAQAEKRREKLIKQLKETKEYDEKIAHLALSRIAIDLDDGVKVNYEKVQTGQDGKKLDILAKI